jgi:predicted ATP-grasp superfamily ATP-dependent carboligase
MENILVVGTNTRPVACSLSKLGYDVYSVDYFGCLDLKPCVNEYKSFLSQKPFHSSGFLSERFHPTILEQMASEYIEQVDHIICCSGVDPLKFPKNKIIGNNDVSSIQNKYKLYKTLKKRFEGLILLPETFIVKDVYEMNEISKSFPDKDFLIKPMEGSGGVGIRKLNPDDSTINFDDVFLQEIIHGVDISTSVISNGYEAQTILVNQQLIGNEFLGQVETYGYCGNIAPNPNMDQLVIENLKEISENIIMGLGLIGSNGVDMIYKDANIHVIEVNPRLQGTFEVTEASLNINMAETHITACNGSIMPIPKPSKFAVKMVVFAKSRSLVGNLEMEGIHDIPAKKVIIEKGEPVATVLSSGKVLEETIFASKNIVGTVYQNLETIDQK